MSSRSGSSSRSASAETGRRAAHGSRPPSATSNPQPSRNAGGPAEIQPPALVLGSGITALGVVRSLGRSEIPLHVLAADVGFVRTSRWYRPPPHDRPLLDIAGLESYLRSLPVERGVLIPTSDHDVMAIAGLPTDLKERFPASQAPEPVLAAMLDKDELRNLLGDERVPHPATLPVEGPDDLEAVTDIEVRQWFIKPRDSQEFNRRLRVKALRPSSHEELRRTLAWLQAEGLQVVLQEYIPGPATNHYFLDGFVDRTGTMKACFARRRLRMSSPHFGNSCATVSIPREEMSAAADDLERLLDAVDYRGPFDAEFKLDDRTGEFRLLEINVRPWWQVEFAALCGVDVVTMAYRDALHLDVGPVDSYPLGVEWILPYHDAAACRHMLATGEITLRDWARSWISARWGGFAWDDPVPGLAAGVELWRRSVKRKSPAPRRPSPPPG